MIYAAGILALYAVVLLCALRARAFFLRRHSKYAGSETGCALPRLADALYLEYNAQQELERRRKEQERQVKRFGRRL
jgi:hypothetical protein